MSGKFASLLAIGVAGVAGIAHGQPLEYHVTDMGPSLEAIFDYDFLSSQSRALNADGDMVGEVHTNGGGQRAWIFTFEHGLILLPNLFGQSAAQAMDLSDRDANGEIIIVGGGVHGTHDYAISPIVWRYSTITGEVVETRDVGNLPGTDEGKLTLVNNDGDAVGYQGENVLQALVKYDVGTGVLEELVFPARPSDLNNAGQIVGGRYVGDLFGSYTQMAVPPDCTSLTLTGINEGGWLAGRAGRPFTDGAGRFMASWVRFAETGWEVADAGSPWDTGFAINSLGDVTIGYGPGWSGGLYQAATDTENSLQLLLPPEVAARYSIDYAYGLNDNQQIAAAAAHAVLLTPVGRMIIPGDVNGDVAVNHADHCAWNANPIDLDGDNDVDDDDEAWLIDRLAVFGFFYQDCNGNGENDFCDISSAVSDDCNENGVPDECEPDCNGDGVPDSCESDCNGNGVPDVCEIASGAVDDCNGNGIPDECDGADTVVAGVTYDPPQLLHEDVTFSDSILITEAGTVADVDFAIRDNFRIGSTTVRLSHLGVTVTLIDRPGFPATSGGFVNLSYDIVLDDEGAGPNIETVGATCCEFSGITSPPSYRPHEPLSAFDGMPREGVWTMEFIGGYPQTFDPKLLSWSISVTDEAVDPGVCCPADFNGDGTVNSGDVLAFLNAWNAQQPSGDFDGNGLFNSQDVLGFLNAWNAGCD